MLPLKNSFSAVFFKNTVVFCNCIPYLWDIIFGETAICFRNWNRARPTAPAICIYETGHKKPKVTAICFFETTTCAQLCLQLSHLASSRCAQAGRSLQKGYVPATVAVAVTVTVITVTEL